MKTFVSVQSKLNIKKRFFQVSNDGATDVIEHDVNGVNDASDDASVADDDAKNEVVVVENVRVSKMEDGLRAGTYLNFDSIQRLKFVGYCTKMDLKWLLISARVLETTPWTRTLNLETNAVLSH